MYLPLWNNVDYNGEVWTEAPPTNEDEENEAEEEEGKPSALRWFRCGCSWDQAVTCVGRSMSDCHGVEAVPLLRVRPPGRGQKRRSASADCTDHQQVSADVLWEIRQELWVSV